MENPLRQLADAAQATPVGGLKSGLRDADGGAQAHLSWVLPQLAPEAAHLVGIRATDYKGDAWVAHHLGHQVWGIKKISITRSVDSSAEPTAST